MIESLSFLRFLDDVSSYNALKDDLLRTYLDKKDEASKEFFTLDTLDGLVSTALRTNT